MKNDDRRHHHPSSTSNKLHKFSHYLISNHKLIIYLLLLLLTYILGYFSNSSSSSSHHYNTNINLSHHDRLDFSTSETLVQESSSSSSSSSSPSPPLAKTVGTSKCDQVNTDDHFRFSQRCSEPIPVQDIRQKIMDGVFNGTSPYENFPPAHLAHLLRPKRVKGWGSYGSVFETLISKIQPKIIIEVGTFLGASAIHMSELTRKLGLDTQIICLDDFRGWPGFRERFSFISMQNGDVLLLAQFMQNVVTSNATGSIIPVPFSTGSGLQKLCEWGIKGDLIEVDAGHDFHSAWIDINQAYKLLRPGGVIFGHDYFLGYDNRGVRRAVDLFARVNGFNIKVDGQHWIVDSS